MAVRPRGPVSPSSAAGYPPEIGSRMITRSASSGSSRTCSAWPSPVETMPKEPWSSSARNARTAASTASGSSDVHSASVVWRVWSMRMRRDMRTSWGGTGSCLCYARATPGCEGFLSRAGPRPSPVSEPELLAHDPRDLAAVGAALGLAHHEADDDADRLHVAGAKLLDDRGVGVERLLDDRLERGAAADRAQALRLDDPPRGAALGDEPVEHLLGRVLGDLALGDHADERGERARLDARLGRVLDLDAGDELVDPVGQRLGVDAVRSQGRLEVVAELGAPGEQPGAVGREPEVALEALRARGGQLGHRRPRALEHLLGDPHRDEIG